MVEKEKKFYLDDSGTENAYCQSASDLKKCLTSGIETILENVTDEKFIEIYKTCYREFEKNENVDRPSLSGSSVEARKYRRKLNTIVLQNISESIDSTLIDMDEDLRALEKLKEDQSGSTVFWRPPGNAALHMIPFEIVCLNERKKKLESKVEKELETIQIIKARLMQKRLKAKELHGVLLSLIDDIETMVTSKTATPSKELN